MSNSKYLLIDYVCCGRALLPVSGSTPYNVDYGRVPQQLPDMNRPIDDAVPGTARHVQRMGEISVQAMVNGTAQARAKRALATKTRPAGQSFEYKVGDTVDFHRASTTKDASSWKGPAKEIDTTNITRGTLTNRYQIYMQIEVRLQDVRRHLDYFCRVAGQYAPLDPGSSKSAHL